MLKWLILLAAICIVFGFVGLMSNLTADDIAGILPTDFTGTTAGFGNLQLIFMGFATIFVTGGIIYVAQSK